MDFQIIEPKSIKDYQSIEDIQRSAWGMNDIDIVPYRIIIAIHKAGGNVLLAYANDEPIGFVLGFFGLSGDRLFIHSHQLGVKREYWGRGVGYLLKLKQREFALSRNIDLIRWTFDPLIGRNAHLNFFKLGAINNTYLLNVYGEMRDKLNYGVPSDRFYVEWWVDSKRVKNRLSGIKPPKVSNLINDGISIINSVNLLAENYSTFVSSNLDNDDKLLLVEIPYSIEKVKEYSLDEALKWRMETRKIFETYFNKGYIAVDFLTEKINGYNRSFYVLIRETKTRVLGSNWWELI